MTSDENIQRAVKFGFEFSKFLDYAIKEFNFDSPKGLSDLAHFFRTAADGLDKEAADAMKKETWQ